MSAAERIEQVKELQAARESVLAYARFRTKRHKRIYALHVEGMTTREIARAIGLHGEHAHCNISRTIDVYDRQRAKDQAKRLDLDADILVSWHRYTRGRERPGDRSAIERVLEMIRELPAERPTPEMLERLPREFRERWIAAGLSVDSTPAEVLDAARSWPELAQLLRAANLDSDPFADAAEIPTQPTEVPCSS